MKSLSSAIWTPWEVKRRCILNTFTISNFWVIIKAKLWFTKPPVYILAFCFVFSLWMAMFRFFPIAVALLSAEFCCGGRLKLSLSWFFNVSWIEKWWLCWMLSWVYWSEDVVYYDDCIVTLILSLCLNFYDGGAPWEVGRDEKGGSAMDRDENPLYSRLFRELDVRGMTEPPAG